MGPLESIPIDEMKKVFETNFFGVIRMIKEVMPDMKKRKGGHIIVVSSVMGLQGEWGRVRERVRERGRGGGVWHVVEIQACHAVLDECLR